MDREMMGWLCDFIKQKERLVITGKFFEESMKGRGDYFRYKVDNKHQSSGAFSIQLLPTYEKKYNIDWKETALIALDK
jgi:hypothetical protein